MVEALSDFVIMRYDNKNNVKINLGGLTASNPPSHGFLKLQKGEQVWIASLLPINKYTQLSSIIQKSSFSSIYGDQHDLDK